VIGRRDTEAIPGQGQAARPASAVGAGGPAQLPAPPGAPLPPAAGSGGRRRRVGLAIGGIVLALLLGAAGALFLVRRNPSPPDSAQARAAVRQAYLAWWGARQKAYLELDATPMKPDMTAAGYREEQGRLATQEATHDPLRLVADHNLQVVVYQDGTTASIDDIWVDHSVSLNPQTLQPVEPDPDLTIEDSTVLRRQGGRWLVDSIRRFGVSRPVAGQTVSYAAAAGGRPPPQPVLSAVETAYANYLRAIGAAFSELSSVPLQDEVTGPALARDTQIIQHEKALNQYFEIRAEHNERLGMQTDGTVWLYDTIADHSVSIDRTTHKAVGPTNPTDITRSAYEFVQESDGWKVDDIVGEN
jgi:hypothetical protein